MAISFRLMGFDQLLHGLAKQAIPANLIPMARIFSVEIWCFGP
jgi:hypothetical protein